jgi:hypothetical protein
LSPIIKRTAAGLALLTIFVPAQFCLGVSDTPIADALDWYSIWHMQSMATPGIQTCQGEFQNNLYVFRCDPLDVVVNAGFDDNGRCFVSFMSQSYGPDAGTRFTLALNNPPPSLSLIPVKTGPPPVEPCPELPLDSHYFKVMVMPHSRLIDPTLSARVRLAALKLFERDGGSACLLRFPNVKGGDPAAHVYEECDGVLEAVSEFHINQDHVEDFAQWTYDQPHKSIPDGAEWRRKNPDLWFAASTPEDRKTPTLNFQNSGTVSNFPARPSPIQNRKHSFGNCSLSPNFSNLGRITRINGFSRLVKARQA